MTKEAIGTGKTVEEALENAYRELGVAREEADFEILERPKKSLFGLRVTPARVRVFVEIVEKPAPAPQREAVPQKVASSPRPAEPKRERKEPAVKREPREVRETKEPREPREKTPEKGFTPNQAEEPVPVKERDPAAIQAKVNCAKGYLESIFLQMGLEQVEIKVTEKDDAVVFTLSGEGLGVLIGRRGETLDALQYLSGLVANRLEGDYFRVTIDSGNYREKRERTLEQLARKLSSQVVKTGRSLTLEPMNPYERRIIHSTVQNIDGVASSSIGEEPNRRVVIASTAPRKKYPPRQGQKSGAHGTRTAPPSGDNKERSDKPRIGGEGNRNRKPYGNRRSAPPSGITTRPNAFAEGGQPAKKIDDSAYEIEPPVRTAPAAKPAPKPAPKAEAPAEAKDKPLYSKIDID